MLQERKRDLAVSAIANEIRKIEKSSCYHINILVFKKFSLNLEHCQTIQKSFRAMSMSEYFQS